MMGYEPPQNPEIAEEKVAKVVHQLLDLLNQEPNQPLVYTIEQAAEKMQVSVPTFREHYLIRPDFPQLWSGRKCVIPKKALDEWVNTPEKWNRNR